MHEKCIPCLYVFRIVPEPNLLAVGASGEQSLFLKIQSDLISICGHRSSSSYPHFTSSLEEESTPPQHYLLYQYIHIRFFFSL